MQCMRCLEEFIVEDQWETNICDKCKGFIGLIRAHAKGDFTQKQFYAKNREQNTTLTCDHEESPIT